MRKEQRQYKQNQRISTERVLGKSLPANLDAERSVLSALLLNDTTLSQVSEILIPDDFYSHQHKIIYETILEFSQKFERIDLVTLQDELKKKDKLEVVGGVTYLVSLQEDIPSLGLVEQHAKIIKEKAVLRELIDSATDIITNCYSQDEKNIASVLDEAEKTIFQIANKRTNQSFVQLNIWLKKHSNIFLILKVTARELLAFHLVIKSWIKCLLVFRAVILLYLLHAHLWVKPHLL